MYDMNDENIKLMAVSTLTSIWQCIDWDKVTGKRAMGIWDEFTSKVKSAAMTTNDYDAFVIKLCKKMNVLALRSRDIDEIAALDEKFKKKILECLRNKTQLIVLKLRLNSQIKKELAQKEKQDKEKAEQLKEKVENTQVEFNIKGVKAHEN